MSYARGTQVSVDRSQDEIKTLLRRRGATEFITREALDEVAIGFVLRGVRFAMTIPLPSPDDRAFHRTPARGHVRSKTQAQKAYEDEVRRRHRSLVAVIKAKLVAIEDRVSTFEKEFLPWAVLPDGQTVGDRLAPMLTEAMERGDGVLMLTDQSQNGGH